MASTRLLLTAIQYVSMQVAYVGLNPNPVLRIFAEDAGQFIVFLLTRRRLYLDIAYY